MRGIHRSPANSPHKGQWRGALVFSEICAWIKRLSKQSWGWWFEVPSRSLWRHRNAQTDHKRTLMFRWECCTISMLKSRCGNEAVLNSSISNAGFPYLQYGVLICMVVHYLHRSLRRASITDACTFRDSAAVLGYAKFLCDSISFLYIITKTNFLEFRIR